MAETGIDQNVVFSFFQDDINPTRNRLFQTKAAIYRRIPQESTDMEDLSSGWVLTQTRPPRLARMAGLERQGAKGFYSFPLAIFAALREAIFVHP